jgi:hypothetical protein
MNKTVKIALMSAAVAAAGIALATPEFLFVKDVKSNGMMMTMGKKEVIELAAYPALKLQARNVTKDHATFVFVIGDAKTPLKDAFDYYGKALEKEGWKGADDAMMKEGDAMAKPGDAMAKPGDAMAKPGDAMAKPGDAMAKPGDTMAKTGDTMGAMMKPLTEKYSFKTYTITLSAKETKTNIEVDLILK